MVTGIEAAGLALGLFPIVLEGLKFFISSAEDVKEMKRHKRTLEQFRRDINMEKCKFENTWYALVSRAGMDFSMLGKQPWEAHIEKTLISCLPDESATSFVDGCQDLNTILEELAQKFVKYEQDTAGYLKMLRVLRSFPKEYREAQISRIHRLNFNLDKLVDRSPQIIKVPGVQSKRTSIKSKNMVDYYQRIRKHAILVYGILNEKLQTPTCSCNAPHSANLRLQMRFAGVCKDNLRDLRFNLVLPMNMPSDNALKSLRQTDRLTRSNVFKDGFLFQASTTFLRAPCKSLNIPNVEHFGKVTEAIADQIIQCICSTIQKAVDNNNHAHDIGVLVSNDNKKHRVWIPRKPLYMLKHPKATRAVSLADLLSAHTRAPSRKERLKLGVKLASSVMQLHKTEWLSERWRKEDIVFFTEEAPNHSRVQLVLEDPRVCRVFNSGEAPEIRVPTECRLVRCNQSLFSLGIVLIELWFWKSLESFCGAETASDMEEYGTALGLINDLYDDAGETYGDVVRRCISGLDHRETELEKDDFKNHVYDEIVQPLEKHLEIFLSKSLPEIFAEGG